MTFNELKINFDSKSQSMNYDFKVRIYRALSWGQASMLENRLDDKLIKLWISFNSLYGSGFVDKKEVRAFLESLISVDNKKIFKNKLMLMSNEIKNFISIPELYDVYWSDEKLGRREREAKAQQIIERNKSKYLLFVSNGNNANEILEDVFYLIYLLRNQIFHGSAAYDSEENKVLKQRSINMLEAFIPDIIEIMIDNYDYNWHEVKYKPIRNEGFVPKTKDEKELAIKTKSWLRKVDTEGECQTSPLTKSQRHIVYKILEASGVYTREKYYTKSGEEGLIIKKKKQSNK